MKEKNAPSVMNANNLLSRLRRLFTAIAALLYIAAPCAGAQNSATPPRLSSAPSLYALKEVVISYPIFADAKLSSDCGLTREAILTALQRNMQDPGLDVMMVNETHPRVATRVNLTVEITTARQGRICWSWIHMPFTDRTPILLPPVKIPRMLTLVFWEQKKMVESTDERHQTAVNDMVASMARSFLRDVKLAVPSVYMGSGDQTEGDEKEDARLKALSDSVSQKLISQEPLMEIPTGKKEPPPKK